MKQLKTIIVAIVAAFALAAPAHAFFFGFGAEPATVFITVTGPDENNIDPQALKQEEAKPKMVTYCYLTGQPYGKSAEYPNGKPFESGSKAERELLDYSPHELKVCGEEGLQQIIREE